MSDDTLTTSDRPRLRTVAHLYRLRLRAKPVQEVLAMFGIAAGVALLFAVQIASTSLTGGVRQLVHGITGDASLELAARGPEGVDQDVVAEAQRLPSVRGAAPVLQQPITVVGPAGGKSLNLLGTDERLTKIGGRLVRRFDAKRRDLGALGFFLTTSSAKAIGAERGQSLTIEVGARKQEVILAGTLSDDEIGDLAQSPVALAPLGMAQPVDGHARTHQPRAGRAESGLGGRCRSRLEGARRRQARRPTE